MKFFRTPLLLPVLYPKLLWRGAAHEKTIYLTFDDGPIPGPTEWVLQQLKNFKATATFFCIGDNIRKHGGIFNRIVSAGHAVGNHTFHHVNGWASSTEHYQAEVDKCQQLLPAGGRLFRPPYGRITRAQITALRTYQLVMWDVLTYDFDNALPAERCLQNSIRASRNGSIVVFHDSLKAEKNLMHTLPRYLQHFSDRGYQFRALPPST